MALQFEKISVIWGVFIVEKNENNNFLGWISATRLLWKFMHANSKTSNSKFEAYVIVCMRDTHSLGAIAQMQVQYNIKRGPYLCNPLCHLWRVKMHSNKSRHVIVDSRIKLSLLICWYSTTFRINWKKIETHMVNEYKMLTNLMLEKVAINVDTVNVSKKSTIRMYLRQKSGWWGGGWGCPGSWNMKWLLGDNKYCNNTQCMQGSDRKVSNQNWSPM